MQNYLNEAQRQFLTDLKYKKSLVGKAYRVLYFASRIEEVIRDNHPEIWKKYLKEKRKAQYRESSLKYYKKNKNKKK